ncbi:MAG: MFS transporter [Chloroflexota bacterium]
MAVPLSWLGRDGRVLIAVGAVRAVCQAFMAITLAMYLANEGLSLTQIGVYFSAGAAGATAAAVLVGTSSERLGRRRLLVLFSLLTAVGVIVLLCTANPALLVTFAFVGSITGTPGGAVGSTQPLVQAALAEASPPERRTTTFAIYRMSDNLGRAVGALAAGLPEVLARFNGQDEHGALRVLLAMTAATLAVVALTYLLLAPDVGRTQVRWINPLTLPSRGTILGLTSLFSVDTLGSALLVQSLVAYWFSTRFDLALGELSVVFLISELLTALSLWLSVRLSTRIGLVNTMVFTHIPASVLLVGAAFAPTAAVAIACWQARAFFSQMDVPARDAYTMSVVQPHERVAMASVHALGRSVASTLGPSVGAALWTSVAASAPFVGCAGLKIAYDLALWTVYRKRPTLPEA